ncbi:MAG: CpsD/CapB family tyrosine-protein kinase [Candidatus Acidiferrum sp.]
MSKYFNETQKTEEWFEQEALAKRQDVAAIIEQLRKPSPGPSSTPTNGNALIQPSPYSGRTDLIRGVAATVLNGEKVGHYAMEAYRGLRTQLMRLQAAKELSSVVLSSAMPGEGKTTTILNLGLCYAQLHDSPVLLIDADLRTKRLSQFFENSAAPGLAEALSGLAKYEDVIQRTENPNLYILTAGTPAGSPPELFVGTAWAEFIARCKKQFKMILVDAPPVRPLADFELICAGCDAFMMVVRAYHTQRDLLQQIAGQIDPKKLIGVVLNSAEVSSKHAYYYQYGSKANS